MNSFGRLNQIGMDANATKDKVRYLREKYNLGYDMQPKGKKMETTVLIVVKGKYKVYSETTYPNGYSRRLLATFKTSADAERFMNARP